MPQEEPVDVVAEALAITGMPDWDSPDAPGCRDTLALLPGEGSGADPVWALVPVGSGDDFVPLDP
ncbi:MAG: hypothetical protein IIB57_14070, partial [Planctomycetes bacterium]|nr:hypothetical protein [Planctomycetota bacterium]